MFHLLILVLVSSLLTSFICSLIEAALYAVPLGFVRHLAEAGSRQGKALLRLKEDLAPPITAILVLNTISNSAAPAVIGFLVAALFGETALAVFTAVFAVLVLYFGEIIPKVLGSSYCRSIAPRAALPLEWLIRLFTPAIKLSNALAKLLDHSDHPSVSHQEVLSLAALGTEEGALDHFEGEVISNVIELDKMLVRDVLTPRVKVFRKPENMTLDQVSKEIADWQVSRVPLYSSENEDQLTGYVRQRDVYRALHRGEQGRTLKDIARTLQVVPELLRVDQLLLRLFEQKEHICAVVDEHGALAGIITLEDILEEVVGREIFDEYDKARAGGELKITTGLSFSRTGSTTAPAK
jgi:CBS domain containing-hemolysin-like protein